MREDDLRRRMFRAVCPKERALPAPIAVANRSRNGLLEDHLVHALWIRIPDPSTGQIRVLGDAEQTAASGVHVERRELGVRRRDQVRGRVENGSQSRSRLLSLFAVGDVNVDAGHPAR